MGHFRGITTLIQEPPLLPSCKTIKLMGHFRRLQNKGFVSLFLVRHELES